MNFLGFYQALNEGILSSREIAKKHIIRFRNQEQYQQCIAHIKRLEPALPKLSFVHPIKIIHAISCSLRSDAGLAKYRPFLTIEEDVKVGLHSLHALPAIQPFYRTYKSYQPEQRIPWGVKQIKAPKVWNHTMGSHVKIGVVDTGVDYSHPDIRHCLSRGINLVNRNSPPFDDNGHGTHIIGTIAAANQQSGIVGVAPRASIHPVKAFDHNGSAFVSDIILGIDWCVRNRMDIINMSFGMKNRSQSLLDAVRNAYRSGVIIVASSGNDGKRLSVDYPASFQQTISVGATTKGQRIAPFSNRGKRIDVYAPGDKIFSTWLGGKYNELSGTSMATSHVSGVIALILSIRPGIRPAQMKALLKRASRSGNRGSGSLCSQVNALRAFKYTKEI